MQKRRQTLRLILLSGLVPGVVALCLSACSPKSPEKVDDARLLQERGYSIAPRVTSVLERDGEWLISGLAVADGRVRIVASDGRAAGFTADSKGRFQATLQVRGRGEVFEIFTDDRDRAVASEGRLFVPAGGPQKSVILRVGAPGIPLLDSSALAVVDSTGAGTLAVSGRVAPSSPVLVSINGQSAGSTQSDATGRYSALVPTQASGEIVIKVSSPSGDQTRTVDISANTPEEVADAAEVTPLVEGWRVSWALPGGGRQTTYVFR